MSKRHSLLSPSAAKRWLHCAAAPKLEEYITENYGTCDSAAANEGSLAHDLCDFLLRDDKKGVANTKVKFEKAFGAQAFDEALYYAEGYKRYVDALIVEGSRAMSEYSIDLSMLAPDMCGTVDFYTINGTELHIVDYKYGIGTYVPVYRNAQMMIYAYGILHAENHNIDLITLHIYQPRVNNIKTYTLTTSELLSWIASTVRPAATACYHPQAAAYPGEWCRFCKALGFCSKSAEYYTGIAERAMSDYILEDTHRAFLLDKVSDIISWAEAFKKNSLKLVVDGHTIPGYTIGRGVGRSQITDHAAAIKVLQDAGIETTQLTKLSLIPLTNLKKLLKNDYKLLIPYIEKKEGNEVLVRQETNNQ